MTDIQPIMPQQPPPTPIRKVTTTSSASARSSPITNSPTRRTVLIPVTNIVSAPGGSGMIQELSFAGNESIMQDMETLSIFLRSAPFRTIRTLTLSSCRLGDDGLHALVEALAEAAQYHLLMNQQQQQQHSSSMIALERLDLSDNLITCNALVEDVSRLVKLLPRLQELNLATRHSDILMNDEKTRIFVQQHFQNTTTLLEKLVLHSHDADALFCVEYAVQTTLERNRKLQGSTEMQLPKVAVLKQPPPPSPAAAAANQMT